MNPFTALLYLLVGSQIVTSLAAVSVARRVTSSARHKAEDTPEARQHRVVFQVSVEGEETWQGVLSNVENLQKAFGPERTQVEVVCFGKGIGMLLKADAPLAERIARDKATGVEFAACQNTLRARHLTPADLLPSATTVDSGVAEIIRRQEEGWAYIKGG